MEQYDLRVESGRGFDLNVSLFERLVKNGYPHTTLELQHRMPPEVPCYTPFSRRKRNLVYHMFLLQAGYISNGGQGCKGQQWLGFRLDHYCGAVDSSTTAVLYETHRKPVVYVLLAVAISSER